MSFSGDWSPEEAEAALLEELGGYDVGDRARAPPRPREMSSTGASSRTAARRKCGQNFAGGWNGSPSATNSARR